MSFKSFQQHRLEAVAFPPILGQTFGRQRQGVGRQIFNLHMRHDQKAAVVDHAIQILTARFIIPANPLITRLSAPRRGAEGKAADITIEVTVDQIAQLRAAQRPTAQIVILVHQLIPLARGFGIRAGDENEPQIAQLR